MLKGNKVKEVLTKVSTDCWAKKPHKTARAIQKRVVDIFIIFISIQNNFQISQTDHYRFLSNGGYNNRTGNRLRKGLNNGFLSYFILLFYWLTWLGLILEHKVLNIRLRCQQQCILNFAYFSDNFFDSYSSFQK